MFCMFTVHCCFSCYTYPRRKKNLLAEMRVLKSDEHCIIVYIKLFVPHNVKIAKTLQVSKETPKTLQSELKTE